MTAIVKGLPGYRLIDGSIVNQLIDQANNATGNGTPGPMTASSFTATGPNSLSGATTYGSGSTKAFIASVIAAAGATQGTATLIPSGKVVVTASASTEGIKLPVWATGLEVDVLNVGTAHKFKVYPNVNAKVSTGASNAADATLLAVMKNTVYKAVLTNTWIADRSA